MTHHTPTGAVIHPATYVRATTARDIITTIGLRKFAIDATVCALPFAVLALIWIGTPA